MRLIDGYVKKFKQKKKEFELLKNKHQSYIMPIVLIGGFVVDTFTLNKIDQVFDNLILVTHLLIVGTTIALLFSKDTPFGYKYQIKDREKLLKMIMLFSFGGLFSGFVIFYTRSGSLLNSWPFILLMLILMLTTEFKKDYYKKLGAQIQLFYITLFAYLIFLVPLLINRIGLLVYLASGLLGAGLIILYMRLLYKIDNYHFRLNFKRMRNSLIIVFIVFNFLYFANVIPPIPLAVKARSVYHDFNATSNLEYTGYYEKTAWWNFFRTRSHIFHRQEGEDVYVFGSVFAPVKINTDIYHVWEYFNKAETRWYETNRVKIPIVGGREDGYRGFSKKRSVFTGQWRVRIVTGRNQTIGQIQFKIKDGEPKNLTFEEL